MLRAIYPGSFDPVTYGHLDIIRRSCKIVDELVVGVLNNNAKMPLFSVEERVKMLEEATKDLTNVRIVPFHGLLIDFARQMDAFVIIRGLRAITDFEYELQMSQTNHKLEPEIRSLPPAGHNQPLASTSSGIIRSLLSLSTLSQNRSPPKCTAPESSHKPLPLLPFCRQ